MIVSLIGTDRWRSAASGSSARAISISQFDEHSVFSEKQGSQPDKADMWLLDDLKVRGLPCEFSSKLQGIVR